PGPLSDRDRVEAALEAAKKKWDKKGLVKALRSKVSFIAKWFCDDWGRTLINGEYVKMLVGCGDCELDLAKHKSKKYDLLGGEEEGREGEGDP
ncbi:hypothetical protein KIPB_012631, partial [Kipferlia bialata]